MAPIVFSRNWLSPPRHPFPVAPPGIGLPSGGACHPRRARGQTLPEDGTLDCDGYKKCMDSSWSCHRERCSAVSARAPPHRRRARVDVAGPDTRAEALHVRKRDRWMYGSCYYMKLLGPGWRYTCGSGDNVCTGITPFSPPNCSSGPGGATRAEAGTGSATASHRGGRAPDRSHPQNCSLPRLLSNVTPPPAWWHRRVLMRRQSIFPARGNFTVLTLWRPQGSRENITFMDV